MTYDPLILKDVLKLFIASMILISLLNKLLERITSIRMQIINYKIIGKRVITRIDYVKIIISQGKPSKWKDERILLRWEILDHIYTILTRLRKVKSFKRIDSAYAMDSSAYPRTFSFDLSSLCSLSVVMKEWWSGKIGGICKTEVLN